MDVDQESPGTSVGSAFVKEPDRSLEMPVFHSKTYLDTLPRELVLEIISHCVRTKGPSYMPGDKRDIIRLSSTSKFLREMSIPFIFTTIKNWARYHKLLPMIQAIEGNRSILHVIQHLELSLLGDEKNSAWEQKTPAGLAILLSQMPGLSHLHLNLFHEPTFGASLEGQLLKNQIVLPTVRKFHYGFTISESGPSINFIPKVFPQLDALQLNLVGDQPADLSLSDVMGPPKVAQSLDLKTVSIRKALWELGDVAEIYDFFPDVTTLFVKGDVPDDLMISALIPFFEPFQHLKVLALTDLTDPAEEDVVEIQRNMIEICGYCLPGECCPGDESGSGEIELGRDGDGNHYWDAYEQARDNQEPEEDRGENAEALFRMCPSLESVYFPVDVGNGIFAHRFMPKKDESGGVDEVWEEELRWFAISD